ncbi:MAG: DUF3795 domain-containing protein [Fibromonadaceae bacterium]|nr:DUF3795 domain-containing protein [Fibromonadaceae bacterium]
MKNQTKKHYTLGCCGIDCGLCPRYYTEGESRCLGCFGENFSEKHPPCSFATCCVKKHNLETCGQCKEFPCKKYDNEKIEKDSFVTHKKMMTNLKNVQKNGIEKYIEEQNVRIKILKKMLLEYNDGKSKSYFCIAAALLDIKCLNKSLAEAENEMRKENISDGDLKSKARILKSVLLEYANEQNIELTLQK